VLGVLDIQLLSCCSKQIRVLPSLTVLSVQLKKLFSNASKGGESMTLRSHKQLRLQLKSMLYG